MEPIPPMNTVMADSTHTYTNITRQSDSQPFQGKALKKAMDKENNEE
jgi:hypothetical protein